MSDHDLYYGDFERDGEDAVRSNVALKRYRSQKLELAKEWLSQRDSERSERSQRESLEIAKSAKNAAWAAAIAAMIAIPIAIGAMVISYLVWAHPHQ